MCGYICGETNTNNSLINNAIHTLKHRGPDQTNVFRKKNIFLAHARLSIVDVSGGMQPLVNEDNTIFACVNGEFYDYLPIVDQLKQQGHIFKTHSDSEILIHLYEQYGVDCLKYLHGEFSFALYDENKKRWFCGRDRLGIRPLNYYHKNNTFIASSEAKAIFQLGVEAKLNKNNVWFSQHLQYLPQNGTLFEDIYLVKPGHFILVENGKIKEVAYWSLNNISENNMSFQEAQEKAVYLIEKSVQKRVPEEVKWTCHLSGGIDSSIVSALANKNSHEGTCFTVQFTDDNFYDESVLAQETANYIGAKLIKVPVNFKDMLTVFPEAIYHAEGLSINGHLGAKYLLNKAIASHGFKVAMSGEGSDEIFMGYSHLKQDYLSANSLQNMEKQYLSGVQLPDGDTLDLSIIKKNWGFIPTWLAAKSSMANKFSQLWDDNFNILQNPYEQLVNEFSFSRQQSALKNSSQTWMRYCLSGYILKVLDDAQAMAHSVEGRLPFLDTELVEFMWSVPDQLFFKDNVEKGLLRSGFKNVIPDNVIHKTKQSFMSPPIHWALKDKQTKTMIYDYLLENPYFAQQEIFSRDKIINFLTSAKDNHNTSSEPILMTMLSLAILCDRFKL